MDLKLAEIKTCKERPLNLSKSLKADQYYNPVGGITLYDKKEFANAGVDLKFMKNSLTECYLGIHTFETGLSIIDVMMFVEKIEIQSALNNYILK